MANELTEVNGVTKKEKNGTIYYFFGETVIQAYPIDDYYRLELENGQEIEEVYFDDITDPLGASNIIEYLDAVATAGIFSSTVTVVSSGGGGDATAANQATQIALETTIRDNTNNLDVVLSSRASENTVGAIKTVVEDNIDVKLSTVATEATLAAIKTPIEDNIDAKLSTLATESSLSNISVSVENAATPKDAAGNVPVSTQVTWLNAIMTRDNLPNIFDRVDIGAASQTLDTTTASVAMAVTTASDAAITQTKQRFPYFAGQAQFIEFTLSDFDTEATVTKEAGYFSSSDVSPYTATKDGISIYDDGTTKRLRVYRNGTTVYDVPQSSWDDQLNGAGASGMTVDFEKFNVMGFEFLWLGGTGIRFFIQNGYEQVTFHTINHANTGTTVMIQSPLQPLRFEIRSSSGAGNLNQICGTVKTLGGGERVSNLFTANTGDTKIDANTAGTKYLVKALRIQDGKEGTFVDLKGFVTAAGTTDKQLIEVVFNPTIADSVSLSWSSVSGSNLESATGEGSNPSTTTVTGGTILTSTYGAERATQTIELNGNVRIGTDIDGTKDIIALVATPITANLDIYGGLNYREI